MESEEKIMANRHTLHINKLDSFKKWLVKDGWELLPLSNNYYEVLRAQKAGKQYPLIIYSGKSSEHLSFADRDMSVVGAFLRDSKKPQTNADRIRRMTDEELADFLVTVETYGYHDQSISGTYEMNEWLTELN